MEQTRALVKKVSAHFPMERDVEADFNNKEEIYVKDFEGLRKKIAAMRKDGKEQLNILADFDYTLTRKMYDNEKADNSFKALEHEEVIGKDFAEGCSRARDKYMPIESNPLLTKEEKEKYMIEWWKHTQGLMINTKITKELIRVSFFFVGGKIETTKKLIVGCISIKIVSAERVYGTL